MNSAIIETSDLDFYFGNGHQVLSEINLSVPYKSIYGFLGPNGAGKTTTIRILLGLLKTEKGGIKMFGQDIHSNRISILKKVGSLIEQPSIYLHLTASENLEVFRLSYQCNRKRIDDVLEIVGLYNARKKKVGTYSLGMKQRLGIALALLHDPEILILDEPTNGLDPQGIVEIRELLVRLNREFSKTIFLSSHLLAEVEKIATHFGIINLGRLLFQGTNESLTTILADENHFEIEIDNLPHALLLLQENFSVHKKDETRLLIKDLTKDTAAGVIRILIESKIKVYAAQFIQQNLEELFLTITKS